MSRRLPAAGWSPAWTHPAPSRQRHIQTCLCCHIPPTPWWMPCQDRQGSWYKPGLGMLRMCQVKAAHGQNPHEAGMGPASWHGTGTSPSLAGKKSAGEHGLGQTWFEKFPLGASVPPHQGGSPALRHADIHIHCLHPAQGDRIMSQAGACLGNP